MQPLGSISGIFAEVRWFQPCVWPSSRPVTPMPHPRVALAPTTTALTASDAHRVLGPDGSLDVVVPAVCCRSFHGFQGKKLYVPITTVMPMPSLSIFCHSSVMGLSSCCTRNYCQVI